MDQEEATSEEFTHMMQVIAGDNALPQWFLSPERLPENLRYSLIRSMVEKMRADRVSLDLAEALKSPESPVAYRAAANTVRDVSR